MVAQAPRSLVLRYLAPAWPSLIAATTMALLLGLVSALVMNLIGPGLSLLTADPDATFPIQDLVGPRYAAYVEAWWGVTAVRAGDALKGLPLWLLALAGMKAILSLSQWFLWERAGELASKSVRSDLVSSFLDMDPTKRKTEEFRVQEAALSSCVSTDVRMLREYLVRFFGGLPREGCQVAFLALNLVLLDPMLFAVFFVGVLPAGMVISRIGKKLRRRAAKALEDYSQLTEWLQQRLLGIETIKHYGTEELEAKKMESLTSGLFDKFYRAARVKARTSPLLETAAIASLVVVLTLALSEVVAGETTGAVQMSFFATLAALSQSASKLGRYFNANREGAAAIDRIDTMQRHLDLGRKTQSDESPAAGPSVGVVCQDLTVVYSEASPPALANFSHEFAPGRVHCLVGPSGAGKSTLMNVLLGLVEPSSGSVRATSGKALSSVRTLYMPQKVMLAPDTVAANVAYPEFSPDRERVAKALERVAMDKVVADLPDGIDTLVGEGGAGLSGGQAQRLLLARLCYHQSGEEPLLVMVDEGTSALDPRLEELVIGLLRELADEGACVIMIAHRPAAAEAADEVVTLERGKKVPSS